MYVGVYAYLNAHTHSVLFSLSPPIRPNPHIAYPKLNTHTHSATESEEAVKTRLANARAEIDYGLADGNFEYVLVNDDLMAAYARLKAKLIEFYPHLAARAV